MKRFLSLILSVVLLVPATPLRSEVDADAAARQSWTPVLKAIGVEEGKSMPADQYAALVRKLYAFPPVAVKIRQASTKPITIVEWSQILKGLGIVPKPNMRELDWSVILNNAGIPISKGISPSLAAGQAGAPSAPTLPTVTAAPAIAKVPAPSAASPAPVVTFSPAPIAVSSVTVSTSTTKAAVAASSATLAATADRSVRVSSAMPAAVQAALSVPVSTTSVQISSSIAPAAAAAPAQEPAAVPSAAAAESPETAVTAPKISLELRGMDINEVLKTFAKQGALNVVTNSNVHGSVSISIKNVDLWKALRKVLEANDLAFAYDGTLLHVMTASDYEKLYGGRFDDKTVIETIALKNVKSSAMGKYLESVKSKVGKILVYDYSNTLILVDTPESIKRMKSLAQGLDAQLRIKIYALNYAKADELLPKIQPLVTKDIGDVEIDKRTNRMVVMDFPDHFGPIDTLISAFDRQHRSVLIEAKIVQVTLTKENQLGVNWQKIFSNLGSHHIPGSAASAFTFLPNPPAEGTQLFTATLGTLQDNSYSVILQALESVGKTNLLLAPRITALNNETANILVGTKEAYVTTTVTTPGGGSPTTSAEQINFVDVGVKLHVTPTIGEDNFITIKIKPEVSSVDHTLKTSQGNVVPIVRTSQEETTILVKDGETVLLAGLIDNTRSDDKTGIPWLARIPILGIPFRSSKFSETKTDITVFLTPRILPDEFTAAGAAKPAPVIEDVKW